MSETFAKTFDSAGDMLRWLKYNVHHCVKVEIEAARGPQTGSFHLTATWK